MTKAEALYATIRDIPKQRDGFGVRVRSLIDYDPENANLWHDKDGWHIIEDGESKIRDISEEKAYKLLAWELKRSK